ncbi:protein FAM114A2-like isoform X3 [Leucoraja erinacea]|nr:protein FAM114A2-like isoform X3 [Leucoraja erinacea]XP_055499160.1 protein FAM114A2-like isoform X3 [Leucoraja erinacea]
MEETETTEAPEDKESLISEESLSVAANEGESNKNDVSLQHSKSEHETNTTDNSQTEDHESAERKLQINESKGKNSISMTRKRPESKGSTPGITEQQPSELDDKPKVVSDQEAGSWGYWGNWGKSLLTTATATVASVGHGISHVIEKAESSLGIPSPTEVSAETRLSEGDKENSEEGPKTESGTSSPTSGAFGVFSTITSAVQSTGKTVLSGGLDALEFIGKKTMDVIAEGDPGFKKTRGLMYRTTTLSQVLREAKEREEEQQEQHQTAGEHSTAAEKKANYGILFDEFQGLSHLEALEILSNESEVKVKSVINSLSGEEVEKLKEELETITEAFSSFEFDDEEEVENEGDDGSRFVEEMSELLSELHLAVTSDKIGKVRKNANECIIEVRSQIEIISEEPEKKDQDEKSTCDGLNKDHKVSVANIHTSAVRSLAELTARSIEQFHKVAVLILHSQNQDVGALDRAKTLSKLTVVLCKEMATLSKQFTTCLTIIGAKEKVDILNPLITGVFLEASNSATYIQDAFRLLLPVLQISQIQTSLNTTAQ